MTSPLDEAIGALSRETDRMWLSMPDEVRLLQTRTGTKGYHWPVIICAEENTRAFSDDLARLRASTDDPAVEVESLKRISRVFIESNLGILLNWYGLDRSVETIEQTLPALDVIQTKEEYRRYIHELLVHVGRLHWWVDTLVPWDDVSAFYERELVSKREG